MSKPERRSKAKRQKTSLDRKIESLFPPNAPPEITQHLKKYILTANKAFRSRKPKKDFRLAY